MKTRTWTISLLTLLSLALWVTAAQADPEGKRWSAEVFLGLPELDPIDHQGTDSLGVRLRAPVTNRWSIEASWSHNDSESYYAHHAGDFADLSLRYDIVGNDHLTFFAFAGPGWYSLERPKGIIFFGDIQDPGPAPEGVSYHAGIGLDIRLGKHFYLRPDLRHRVLEDVSFGDDDFGEGSVALGYRF